MTASNTFARYTLRTTDVVAARGFYAALLGQERMSIVPLHEQALARGAQAHWLGQIEVEDVEDAARAFAELGAQLMGPVAAFPDGRKFTVLRDPGGAVVGLTSPGPNDEPQVVVWRQLNTNDLARVSKAYTTLFGWQLTTRVAHPEHGAFQHFAFPGASSDAGAITDITGREGRHAHWLFHFRVADLDRAMDLVRAETGLVLGPFTLPSGERVAVCDDPQGAAFALRG
jgi:predicted enzyme related to lactoylglutathione lyase